MEQRGGEGDAKRKGWLTEEERRVMAGLVDPRSVWCVPRGVAVPEKERGALRAALQADDLAAIGAALQGVWKALIGWQALMSK